MSRLAAGNGLEILGISRRVLAGMVAVTLGAVGIGFVIAAGLDNPNGGTAAIVAPDPAFSPEPVDNAPPVLPPVADPNTNPPPAAPETTPAPSTPPPATTEDEPTTPATPTTPAPAPSVAPPPTPTTAPPAPTAPPPRARQAPSSDNDVFRPDPVAPSLPQVTIPGTQLPPDLATATRTLTARSQAAGISAATRRDLAHVLELVRRYGASPLPGRRATVVRTARANAWWYQRRPAPPDRMLLLDPSGLILSYRPGQGFAVNPVGTTGRWQRLNAAFSNAQLADVLLQLGVSEVRAGRATMTWEYFDTVNAPVGIRPGVSGMAQSRVAKLMAGMYAATGDGRYALAAVQGTTSLAVPVNDGGARSMVAYPFDTTPSAWIVERAYPGEDPWKGAALNGFMVSILELRSIEASLRLTPAASASADPVAATQGADLARQLADEGAGTLDAYLPLHDSGTWSYYGLLTPGYPWRSFLANTSYHCYHVTLLRSLSGIYPDRRFGTTADAWTTYADRQGVRCT